MSLAKKIIQHEKDLKHLEQTIRIQQNENLADALMRYQINEMKKLIDPKVFQRKPGA